MALTFTLYASQLQNLAKEFLPTHTYLKNSSLIRTLFANELRYKDGYGYDFQKIFLALERVGVLGEALGNSQEVMLRFVGDRRPFLLLHLSESALDHGNIYRYGTASLATLPQGFECGYKIMSATTISFAKMFAFLKRNGVIIKSVRYTDGGWSFYLDMGGARIDLPKVVGSGEFKALKTPLWLEVCGASRVRIYSYGRYWHPFIAVYDADLAPLDLFKSYEPTRRYDVTLPNGACYIKISDIFTPKNMKRGFRISLE